jgi:hypothetical protein
MAGSGPASAGTAAVTLSVSYAPSMQGRALSAQGAANGGEVTPLRRHRTTQLGSGLTNSTHHAWP